MPPRPVPCLAGLLLVCASWPSAALAQATVSALQPDKAAALLRFGSVLPEPVSVDQTIGPGDELLSTRNDAFLVFRCADSSTVTFEGSFRVAVLPAAGGVPCAVNLLAGAALVNAVSPDATVQAGEVTMASKGTLYEVRVGREGSRLARDLLVYDGQVGVTFAESQGGGGERGRAPETPTVSSGERLVIAAAGTERARIGPRDIEQAARAYARTDLTRAADLTPADRERALSDLVQGYVHVLGAPGQPTPRLELAARQVDYHVVSRATFYQLSHAERLAETTELHAVIALTAGAAYEQLGDAARARAAFGRATTIDPAVRSAPYLKNYRLPLSVSKGGATMLERETSEARESRLSTVLGISAEVTAASPARAGQPVAIRVVVRSTAGELLEGATVTIAAGGGAFAAGRQTSVSGRTDVQGVFTAEWSCQPCAPAYGLDVTVTKSGFAEWKGSVTVKIGEPRPAAAGLGR